MLFSTGNNVIDIDILNTKELYYGRLGVWQRCQCPVCSNFDENIQRFDENKLRFFKELGISPDKCYDLWAYEPGKSEGTQRYILSYPVVCKCINYTQISKSLRKDEPHETRSSHSTALQHDARRSA